MKQITTSFQIGALERTLRINIYDWGVNIVCQDKTDEQKNCRFDTCNFYFTKRYSMVEDNIIRGMKRFKATSEIIKSVINEYKNNK